MGIQAMILTLKANKRNKRNHFDKSLTNTKSVFGEFVDHKKMNTYEYATFQKKVFEQKRRQRKKYYLLVFITIIGVIIILFLIPVVWNLIFNPVQ